jgi:hypothetical protein
MTEQSKCGMRIEDSLSMGVPDSVPDSVLNSVDLRPPSEFMSWREFCDASHIGPTGLSTRNEHRWCYLDHLIDDTPRNETGWLLYLNGLEAKYTHGWAILKGGVRIGMAYEDAEEAWTAILGGTVRPVSLPKRIGDATNESVWNQPTFPGRKSAKRAGFDLRQGLYLKTEMVRKHYSPPPKRVDPRAPFTLGDLLGQSLRGEK